MPITVRADKGRNCISIRTQHGKEVITIDEAKRIYAALGAVIDILQGVTRQD